MYTFNWAPVFRDFHLLWKGLLLGIGIAILALAIGCILGLIGAFARAYGSRQLRARTRLARSATPRLDPLRDRPETLQERQGVVFAAMTCAVRARWHRPRAAHQRSAEMDESQQRCRR